MTARAAVDRQHAKVTPRLLNSFRRDRSLQGCQGTLHFLAKHPRLWLVITMTGVTAYDLQYTVSNRANLV